MALRVEGGTNQALCLFDDSQSPAGGKTATQTTTGVEFNRFRSRNKCRTGLMVIVCKSVGENVERSGE